MFYSSKDPEAHVQPNILTSKMSIELTPSLLYNGDSVLAHAEASDLLLALRGSQNLAKLILIDPPYNRHTKFHHYDDNMCSKKWSSSVKENCSALRDLLTPDGSLWMHIDDAEMPRARIMLDAVFGSSNFVATVVWQKSVSRDNRMAIATTHEYILVYAKSKTTWHKARHKLTATQQQLSRYKNPDDDHRGAWSSGDLTAKAGPGRRESQFYNITLPSGRVVSPSKGTSWRYTQERFDELVADRRIDFGKGNKMPRLKRFMAEVEPGLVPNTWWEGESVGTADSAKRHLKSLFPNLIPFETPKPEELASRIIQIATNPGDLVVDVYGGSGTTAAVAHKMNRQWLMCEKIERTFYEFTLPRLEMVVKGDDPGGITQKTNWLGGGDFIMT